MGHVRQVIQVTGERGQPGETGEISGTGETSDAGDTGKIGDTGDTGETGETGDNGKVEYFIIDDPSGFFTINHYTGWISVARPMAGVRHVSIIIIIIIIIHITIIVVIFIVVICCCCEKSTEAVLIRCYGTQRTAEGSVFLAPSVCVFCLCVKYLRNR